MQQTVGWHVDNWGTWGWLETGVKAAGLIAGVLAFFDTSGMSTVALGDHPKLLAVILLGLMSLLTFGVLFFRIQQKEIISILFAILNLVGHIGAFIALLRLPDSMVLLVLFAVLYAVGQAVKVQFLRVSGYTEGGQTSVMMERVAIGMLVPYALLAILLLL